MRFRLLPAACVLAGVAACGARSNLAAPEGDAGEGAGGATASVSSTSSASSVATSSSSGAGGEGGGAPITCDPPLVPWSVAFPASGDVTEPVSTVDELGNTYLFAAYHGGPDLGPRATGDPGSEGMLLAKLDPCGNVLWIRPMPGTEIATATSGVVAGDRVIFGGSLPGSIDFGTGLLDARDGRLGFVVAFDFDGAAVWTRALISSGVADRRASVEAVAYDGNSLFITGGFTGMVDFGDHPTWSVGDKDIFLARLEPSDGSTTWAQAYGSAVRDEGVAVAATDAGELCLATKGEGQIGWPNISPAESTAFVQLDASNGLPRTAIAMPDATPTAVVAAGSDCIVVGGYSPSLFLGSIALPTAVDGWNGFAARIGPAAAVLWARPIGPDFGVIRAAAVDAVTGDALVGGTILGGWTFEDGTVLGEPVTGRNSLFVLALAGSTGAFTWGRTHAGSIYQGAWHITPRADGALVISGTLEPAGLDLGQGPLGGPGELGVFAARILGPSATD